jgi:hypothetical protein
MSGTAAAQAAPQGMRRLPMPYDWYQHPSLPLNSQLLLNLMAEQEPTGSRAEVALISTPGLEDTGWTLGAGPVLAINSDMPGSIYAISGAHAYRLNHPVGGTTTITDLGSVGTASVAGQWDYNVMPTIAVGPVGAVICVPPRAYTCTHGGTLNQIGGTFPGALSVAALDGYFVYTSIDPGTKFFCNLLLDPTAFNALDFAYADAQPNILSRVITLNGELWFMGDAGLEVWFDSGDGDFPFRKRSGGVISNGLAATRSVAIGDNSVFWLGEGGIVFRSQGYRAVRISNHAIEAHLRFLGLQNVVAALSYTQDGKVFYVLSYSTATFVYDCSTKTWHARASTVDGTGPWRASAVAQFTGSCVFGDSLSGKLFYGNPNIGTEAGVQVLRQFTLPPIWGGTHRAFCSRVEVEMEVGGEASPQECYLTWSDNGGRTITSSTRTLHTGIGTSEAALRARPFTTRLGSFRSRVFTVSAAGSDSRVAFYAVDADIQPGSS